MSRVIDFLPELEKSKAPAVTEMACRAMAAVRHDFRNLHPTCQENDKLGSDFIIELSGLRVEFLDIKVRWKDHGKHDLVLETEARDQAIGWALDEHKRCDFILWLFADSGRFWHGSYPALRAATIRNFDQWRALYEMKDAPSNKTCNGIEPSKCLAVPESVLEDAVRFEAGLLGVCSFIKSGRVAQIVEQKISLNLS